MCRACGELLSNYLRNKTTKEFIFALESDTRISVSLLLQGKKGGIPVEQGIWVHPDVAINLGQWCSPKFAVVLQPSGHSGETLFG